MSLTNLTFIGLVLPALLFMIIIPFYKNKTVRKWLLLLISIGLYALCEPLYIVLLLAVIVVNYIFVSLAVKKDKKAFRYVAIVINAAILLFFKYINFVVPMLAVNSEWKKIVFPIGLSYYIFKAISYDIDSKEKAYSLLDVGIYISNFTNIISGPIQRFENEIQDINKEYKVSGDAIYTGLSRFVIGLSKKILIADSLSLLVNQCFDMNNRSMVMAWVGAIAYSLQLYFDFSGYTDMAIGVGKLVGFDLMENFNYPYMAVSVSDFWKRWHISLTQWFTRYIYIPLGGSRVKSKARHIFNLAVVWFVTGIWHGSKATFLVWALIYFVFQALEKYTGINAFLKKIHLHRVYTLIIICLCWVIFRADNLPAAFTYIKGMFLANGNRFINEDDLKSILCYSIPLVAGIVFSTNIGRLVSEKLSKIAIGQIVIDVIKIVLFVVCILLVMGNSYSAPLYAGF